MTVGFRSAEKPNCHLVVISLDALGTRRKHSIIVRYILKLFKTGHWLRGTPGGHLAGNAVKCFVRLLWAAQDTWSYWCLLAAKAEGRARAPAANQRPESRQLWPIRGSGSSHTGHRTLGITNISKILQQTDRKYWTLPALVSEILYAVKQANAE